MAREVKLILQIIVLWEDDEFWGFSPISQFDGPLDLRNRQETRKCFEEKNERLVRICCIFVAAKKIVSTQKWIFYEETTRKFYTARSEEQAERRAVAAEAGLGLKVREPQQKHSVHKDVQLLQEAAGACELAASKDDVKQVTVHGNSPPVEEEEVILFRPITRHNSAPLHLPPATPSQVLNERDSVVEAPSGECLRRGFSLYIPKTEICIDPVNHRPSITGSNSKTLWQEPIPEDSVVDSFTESPDSPSFRALSAESDEVTSRAGPPSLSAWFVNQDNNWIAEEKELKEGKKPVSGNTDDIAFACLSGLSIGGNEVSQQDINLKSSASASHFTCDSTYTGDPVSAQRNSYSSIHHKAPPYMPPMPSAPLLPDNVTWFTGNSSNYAENRTLEHGKGLFPVAAQVSSYPNYTVTHDTPNFNPIIPVFIDGYVPYTSQTISPQWLQQYQVSFDQTHDHVLPVLFYTPTTLGYDVSREPPYSQRMNPSLPPVNHIENLPYYPSFIGGANEQKKEMGFPAYTEPTPYGATKDLRSEQLLLLKYLKEKEWYLQQEARLRGSV